MAKLRAETAKIEAETAAKVADRPPPQPVQVREVVHQSQEGPGQQIQNRRDRIPRPQVDEGISQSDWNFFSSQWAIYVKGTGIVGDSVVLHLWEACSESLQRSLHHAGAGTEEDADRLMATIKTLAVKNTTTW